MYEARQNKEKVSRTFSPLGQKKGQISTKWNTNRMADIIQRVEYIRGIINDEKITNDIARLKKEAKPDINIESDNYDTYLSDILGGTILSVSRYNKGQKKYYAPVGYIINVDNPQEDVLGNYKGDGNTSNPNTAVLNQWIKSIKKIVSLYDNIKASSSLQEKDENVKQILREYFNQKKFQDPLGSGSPSSLGSAEKSILDANEQIIRPQREIKYTESIIHLKGLDKVLGAYYNVNYANAANNKKTANQYNELLKKNDLYRIDENGNLIKDTSPVLSEASSYVLESIPSDNQ